MLDIVSVFCSRDIALQRLQAHSIATFFDRSGLNQVFYIWNDSPEIPPTLQEELASCLEGLPFRLLHARELGVEPNLVAVDGWTTQQALKLLAARHVTTGNYLVLDAKNHFLRPSSDSDFVATDGRGVFPFNDLSTSDSYRYCLRYFGIDALPDDPRGVLNVTPFLFRTEVVQRLLLALEQKEERSVAEVYLTHQHGLSEFLAYQAFFRAQGGKFADLYLEAKAPHEAVLRAPNLHDPVEFEHRMALMEHGEVKVGGLHWAACCTLCEDQGIRLGNLWRDLGLVDSIEDARKIIDSATRNLSAGDRNYLRSIKAFPLGEPDVTVIVPVYNKAAYLSECLQSILDQSLWRIELICVDDASTDDSGLILERFAALDRRISVLRHEQNRGASVARNTGLATARGKFILFADADDLLPANALGSLLDRARADNVKVVRGSVVGFHSETPQEDLPLANPGEQSRVAPLDHEAFWIPWWHTTYLFSRHFLQSQEIDYPELCSGEDPVFLARVITRVPLVSTISEVTYRYRLLPLAQKGRTTYTHLRDYIRHAEMIKNLFLSAKPEAWHQGFAPLCISELRTMVTDWPMEPAERAAAEVELNRIFDLPEEEKQSDGARRLLFLYNVCGLGGVETSIINKMAALQNRGVETKALFEAYWGEGGKSASEQPCFVIEEDEDARAHFIRTWSPDALVVIDSPWMLRSIEKSGVASPVLFETHLSDQLALQRRVLDGVANQSVAKIIVPSAYNRSLLTSQGINPDRVRIIPNAIDLARFRPDQDSQMLQRLGLPADRRLLIFVGRLEPQKNPREFLLIAKRLIAEHPGVHGVVVGDAVDTEDYAAAVRAEAAPQSDSVSFIERIPYAEMPLLYSAVAASGGCLISTSLNESQPMILLEAMACGCPVVATNVGGVPEIIADGHNGHLYESGNIDGAVAAVSRLTRDPEHRAAVTKAATAHVRAKHAPDRTAEAYLAMLDELAGVSSGSDGHNHSAEEGAQNGVPTKESNMISLAQRLTRLFSERVLAGVRQTVVPYRDLVPRVHMGFEPTASVELEMYPKEDFSRSPDACLNTLLIDYKGPSRWLTLEAGFKLEELDGAEQYQIGVYARPSRTLPCKIVLRFAADDDTFTDYPLCDLVLTPEGRSAHGRGQLRKASSAPLDESGEPKLLLFFDSSSDLHLELDYLTAYFA